MRLLEHLGPLSLSALAHEAGVQLGTMSGLVDKLASAGLITRERDPKDRRKMMLAASPEAAAKASKLYRDQVTAMANLLDSYDAREFETILCFLEDASRVLAKSTSAVA